MYDPLFYLITYPLALLVLGSVAVTVYVMVRVRKLHNYKNRRDDVNKRGY